ncbi:hypothetical protein AWN76_014550 [Rhodothermaceae bacterium RA]|nr:hypothetical protein AWN76_014550 [Rhodothermaceae bacterium RA]
MKPTLLVEALIPALVDGVIRQGPARVRVLCSEERRYGVNGQEDRPALVASIRALVASIRALVDAGRYPDPLWT